MRFTIASAICLALGATLQINAGSKRSDLGPPSDTSVHYHYHYYFDEDPNGQDGGDSMRPEEPACSVDRVSVQL